MCSYCECFAAGVYCSEPCSCQGCLNKPIHEEIVLSTRKQIELRNPLAFAPKVIRMSDAGLETGVGVLHFCWILRCTCVSHYPQTVWCLNSTMNCRKILTILQLQLVTREDAIARSQAASRNTVNAIRYFKFWWSHLKLYLLDFTYVLNVWLNKGRCWMLHQLQMWELQKYFWQKRWWAFSFWNLYNHAILIHFADS